LFSAKCSHAQLSLGLLRVVAPRELGPALRSMLYKQRTCHKAHNSTKRPTHAQDSAGCRMHTSGTAHKQSLRVRTAEQNPRGRPLSGMDNRGHGKNSNIFKINGFVNFFSSTSRRRTYACQPRWKASSVEVHRPLVGLRPSPCKPCTKNAKGCHPPPRCGIGENRCNFCMP